jgi:transposase-like protein
MTKLVARDPIYRRRRFSPETIELCVRWYITYRLSYRDLVAMMAEREIVVSHTTIMRWVLRYVPEYERRWVRFARSPGTSWRMDETAVAVRGDRQYLYRAVDRRGKSVASLLCGDRSMASAQAFFLTAVCQVGVPWPEKINVDGNSATHRGLRLLGEEDTRWRDVEIRARRYLNNVVEQNHRAIKQRCAPMLGLKTLRTAAITLAGVELAHRIRKRQYSLPTERYGRPSSLKESWSTALGDPCVPTSRNGERNPPMHQNSAHRCQGTRERMRSDGRVRYSRKMFFGGNLCLLVTPQGGRYWHYHYRYGGKRKTLSLGTFPDVPVARSRSRHVAARQLLAAVARGGCGSSTAERRVTACGG